MAKNTPKKARTGGEGLIWTSSAPPPFFRKLSKGGEELHTWQLRREDDKLFQFNVLSDPQNVLHVFFPQLRKVQILKHDTKFRCRALAGQQSFVHFRREI